MINLTLTDLQVEALNKALEYYLFACKHWDDRFQDHIIQIEQIQQQIERSTD